MKEKEYIENIILLCIIAATLPIIIISFLILLYFNISLFDENGNFAPEFLD